MVPFATDAQFIVWTITLRGADFEAGGEVLLHTQKIVRFKYIVLHLLIEIKRHVRAIRHTLE